MSDVTIVGLGMGPGQLTDEARRALSRCERVFYMDTGVATKRLIEDLGPPATPLYGSYRAEQGRLSSYQEMAVEVVHGALDGPVGLAVHGHPLVFVYAPVLIRDMCELLGLSVRVLPGISSMACLFSELMLDPGVNGLLAYEATDLLLRRRRLLPDVPTLIWQVGNVETRLHTTRSSRPERLERLGRLLRRHYPPEHPVVSVYVGPHPLVPTETLRFPLSELEAHAGALHRGVTLYLAPASTRPVVDVDLLARVDDLGHLREITE